MAQVLTKSGRLLGYGIVLLVLSVPSYSAETTKTFTFAENDEVRSQAITIGDGVLSSVARMDRGQMPIQPCAEF